MFAVQESVIFLSNRVLEIRLLGSRKHHSSIFSIHFHKYEFCLELYLLWVFEKG